MDIPATPEVSKPSRNALLLLWHLLPEAGWRALGQGYLLVTVGRRK